MTTKQKEVDNDADGWDMLFPSTNLPHCFLKKALNDNGLPFRDNSPYMNLTKVLRIMGKLWGELHEVSFMPSISSYLKHARRINSILNNFTFGPSMADAATAAGAAAVIPTAGSTTPGDESADGI